MKTKVCSRCKQEKNIDDFCKNSSTLEELRNVVQYMESRLENK